MIIRRKFTQIASALALGGMLASAPAFAQEVVNIGFSGPLSGGAAQYGKNTLDGLKFAIDELNATGFEVGRQEGEIRSRCPGRQVQPQRNRDQLPAPGAAEQDARGDGAPFRWRLRGADQQRAHERLAAVVHQRAENHRRPATS